MTQKNAWRGIPHHLLDLFDATVKRPDLVYNTVMRIFCPGYSTLPLPLALALASWQIGNLAFGDSGVENPVKAVKFGRNDRYDGRGLTVRTILPSGLGGLVSPAADLRGRRCLQTLLVC